MYRNTKDTKPEAILNRKNKAGATTIPDFKYSYNNQNNVAVHKNTQTNEQNTGPRNESTPLNPTDLHNGTTKIPEEGQSVRQVVLRKPEKHFQKTETSPLPPILCKHQLKIHQCSKYKTQNYETTKRKYRGNTSRHQYTDHDFLNVTSLTQLHPSTGNKCKWVQTKKLLQGKGNNQESEELITSAMGENMCKLFT